MNKCNGLSEINLNFVFKLKIDIVWDNSITNYITK